MSQSLHELPISNQCVLVCDLTQWENEGSPCWSLINGSQDEVGQALAGFFANSGITRLDDFGGVCETFLCKDDQYLADPPKSRPTTRIQTPSWMS